MRYSNTTARRTCILVWFGLAKMRVGNRQFLRFGLPFLSFMVGGLYSLDFLISGRHQIRDQVDKQKQLLLKDDKVSIPARSSGLSAEDLTVAAQKAAESKDYEIIRVPR